MGKLKSGKGTGKAGCGAENLSGNYGMETSAWDGTMAQWSGNAWGMGDNSSWDMDDSTMAMFAGMMGVSAESMRTGNNLPDQIPVMMVPRQMVQDMMMWYAEGHANGW